MQAIKLQAGLDEIENVSSQLIDKLKINRILLFYGEMGSGKTTLIKNLCKFLKVNDDVSSPTYSIVNEYNTIDAQTIYHFDFYRLESEEEAFDMGYEEYLYSGNVCLVEWPDKIASLLPENSLKVYIQSEGDKRNYTISD